MRRRDVKSSIWAGRRGMEWILTCFADIRDWVPGQDVHCKRFRDNEKLIEFYGRSNKAGLFVVLMVYFGGAWRGCVMIPTSFNHAGWSLFQKELGNFLSGAKPATLAGVASNNIGGDGQSASGGRNRIIYLFMVTSGSQENLKKWEPFWGITRFMEIL